MRVRVQRCHCELALIGELRARGVRRQLEPPAACQMRCKRLCGMLRLSHRTAAARHPPLRHHARLQRRHCTLKELSKSSGADATPMHEDPAGRGDSRARGWGLGARALIHIALPSYSTRRVDDARVSNTRIG